MIHDTIIFDLKYDGTIAPIHDFVLKKILYKKGTNIHLHRLKRVSNEGEIVSII